MTALYIILALSAGIIVPALILAPEGWEDPERGFIYGPEYAVDGRNDRPAPADVVNLHESGPST